MGKPHFEILSGKLPAGNHHFSILVFDQVDEEAQYYELKPKYFGRYPASTIFKRLWNYFIRPTMSVSAAVTWRATKMLLRSRIKPSEVKYMTTVVMPAITSRPARYRHVAGVKLSDEDFQILKRAGMLRELYRGDASDNAAMRDSMFGLLPIAARTETVAA